MTKKDIKKVLNEGFEQLMLLGYTSYAVDAEGIRALTPEEKEQLLISPDTVVTEMSYADILQSYLPPIDIDKIKCLTKKESK